MLFISGEPGIGKSRLTVALGICWAGNRTPISSYFCSPHHQDSALFPIINLLERAAGFGREDLPGVKLEKLKALMAETSAAMGDVALLAELLLLPTGATQISIGTLGAGRKKFSKRYSGSSLAWRNRSRC